MIKPFKEVILFDNTTDTPEGWLKVVPTTNFRIKENAVHILWRGSVDKFKKDFEIPNDVPLTTKETKMSNGIYGSFARDWNLTTMTFKFTYHIWYRDKDGKNSDNYYVNGSNTTIDIVVPNVLVFDGSSNPQNDAPIYYAHTVSTGAPLRLYNPNLFPLPISVTDFIISNKTNNFNYIQGSGTDSSCYLIFRYGVGGDDIQICLLTRDTGNFSVNGNSLIIPYASLTFTGFHSIKRLK